MVTSVLVTLLQVLLGSEVTVTHKVVFQNNEVSITLFNHLTLNDEHNKLSCGISIFTLNEFFCWLQCTALPFV
jgi:hypothetical protein